MARRYLLPIQPAHRNASVVQAQIQHRERFRAFRPGGRGHAFECVDTLPTRQGASFVVHHQATPEEQAEIREARAASTAKRSASAAQAKAAKRQRLERDVREACGEGAADEDYIPGDE